MLSRLNLFASRRTLQLSLQRSSSTTQKDVIFEKPDPGSAEDSIRHSQEKASFSAKFVEPQLIQPLYIAQNIEKIKKEGSIFNNYFLGSFDKDLLRLVFIVGFNSKVCL